MNYYSVRIHGKYAETHAVRIREEFRGRRPDYTGHPFFYVENHSDLAGFTSKVRGMLPRGHTADVAEIDEDVYNGR